MDSVLLLITGLVLGLVGMAVVVFLIRKRGDSAPMVIGAEIIAERVRAVGKLVGLEVHAKEIATSTKGWDWMPPILLSQAKIAMIFAFEKQYFVDLQRVTPADIEELGAGRFRVRLPEVEGALRLVDVQPYDIQAGRILGLLDVIQMNAKTQKELMRAAQDQAGALFKASEAKYLAEARRSCQTHLESLLGMFGVRVEVTWAGAPQDRTANGGMEIGAAVREKMRV
jgi:hypothetical protein